MPSAVSPQWREKASGFFSSSGVKLKQAGQSAGSFVGDVAKDAGENVVDAAEKVGSMVKSRWALLREARQQRSPPPPRETVQERLLSAAATTGFFFRKGISETKEKVVVGKMKVEEAAKKTAGKSKVILNNIERWQKGVASGDVFGLPIEATVQRQHSTRPIPEVLVKCANYLIISGLHTERIFKSEGDSKVIRQLISLYNQDWNASLPEGVNAVDVAALMKCYLASLPEPLTTFELYHEIRDARNSINEMRNILKKLPNVSYTSLEFITALLLRVSQKSSLNKMDAHSLAVELAPVIMWQKDDPGTNLRSHLSYSSKTPSRTIDLSSSTDAWKDLLGDLVLEEPKFLYLIIATRGGKICPNTIT